MTDAFELLSSLVLEDGQRWGDAAKPWQVATARHVLGPSAPPNLWETRPRGGSKTTDAAALSIVLLVKVLPPGSRIDVYAADRDQARLIVDAIAGFAARTPALRSLLTIASYRVEGRKTGSVLEVLAADAASAWGRKPSVVIADEVCQWGNSTNAKTVWHALSSSLGKVKGAKLICLSTSGDPAGWQYRTIYQTALASERWTVREIPGPLPWADPNYLAEQKAMLPEFIFRRVHCNEWAAAQDRLTTLDDLQKCVTLEGALPPVEGRRYVCGLDGGLKHDRAVAAICHGEPILGDDDNMIANRVVLDRMEVWQGSPKKPIQLAEIEEWLLQAASSYAPLHIIFDPWQLVGTAQNLRRRGVRDIEEFNFSQASNNRLAAALHTSIRNHHLSLPDDEALLDEIANLRLIETATNTLKVEHDPDRFSDRAIALALAIQKLMTAPPPRRGARLHLSPRHLVPRPIAEPVSAWATLSQ